LIFVALKPGHTALTFHSGCCLAYFSVRKFSAAFELPYSEPGRSVREASLVMEPAPLEMLRILGSVEPDRSGRSRSVRRSGPSTFVL
jgi:hypothetical protein